MAIELTTESRAARTYIYGSTQFVLPVGKSIKIETAPDGEELLDAIPPEGKTWQINISVNINETDL